MTTPLTTHFSLEEFVHTQHRGVDNSLPQGLIGHAMETCQMMERIRTKLAEAKGRDMPILVSSGFRCLPLNRMIGSADTSDHPKAWAMDWMCPGFGTPFEISNYLKDHVDLLDIGQLIHEFGTWIHCGVPKPQNLINRVITIDRMGTRAGILPVR